MNFTRVISAALACVPPGPAIAQAAPPSADEAAIRAARASFNAAISPGTKLLAGSDIGRNA